jgi:hypothetical protein
MASLVTLAGIALPSLVVVLALRRWISDVPWRIAAFLLILTVAFLHGAVFSSRLPVPVDEVARGYPWRGVFGDVRARNPLTNDTVKLFLPWMQVAREELFHGRAPLWNPYSFSGYPLLGNGESAPFSPLFLATLFVPLPKQLVAMAGLKIFLSLLFGYLFLKREGCSDAAACFGASAFAFSVYETTVLYYSAASVSALLPAALFSVSYAIDAATRRGVVLVALVTGSLLANGHPESVFHVAIAVIAAAAVDFAFAPGGRTGIRRDVFAPNATAPLANASSAAAAHTRGDWLRRFRYPLLGALAGAALSAPAWVPTLEMIPRSTRYAELHAAPPATPLPLTALWAVVSPNGFGHPLRHNWNWISNYTVVSASYVGLAVLALAAAAAVSRRTTPRERSWVVLALILYLVAMRWSVIGRLVNAVPPFSIAANDKLRFVACFFAALVAAKTIDRTSRTLYLLFALAFGALALEVWLHHRALMRPLDLLPLLLLLALVPLLSTRYAATAALTVTLVELFALNAGFNALVPARYYRPELPIIQELQKRAPAEPFRIAGLDWTLLPNASAQYGLEDIRGSDPMSLASYTAWLRPLTVRDPATDLDRLIVTKDPRLDFLGVRFLLGDPSASAGPPWVEVYRGPDGALFENRQARPRFVAESATVVATQESPATYRLRVAAGRPAVVASSLPAAPGWRVIDRGKGAGLVELEGGVFLTFRVPAGLSELEVTYRPRSFVLSLWSAALAILLLLAWPGELRRRRQSAIHVQ